MNIEGPLTRLAAMDRDELRFRAACEARKLAGRLRHAVIPAPADRRALARILDPASGAFVAEAANCARRGDHAAAHRALSAHIARRGSRWPIHAASRPSLVEALREDFHDAAAEAVRRAERILEGRHDLLGYRDLFAGSPPDWHADVVHGTRAPLAHWTRVPFLDPAIGDHKIIWELNRQQYFLALGAAYWLTGDARYRDAAVRHLNDWIENNPRQAGINWASMLELAFRALSWTWAVEFFAADADRDDTPWLVDLFVSLDSQLTHVSQNLSRYFSPNTHLLGEALALYAVSSAFPELRRSPARVAEGRAILLEEATRQVHPDGGHAELSPHYHRYATDFYLLALMIARRSGDAAASAFQQTAHRLAGYLRTIADADGQLPLIGDDDGGQLFAFGTSSPADASSTLAVAGCLLADGSLPVRAPGSEVYWILGRRPALAPASAPWRSRALPDAGYFVSRGPDGSHLVFDAGRHGFLNGGHAHADALSIVLRVGEDDVLVDPGTGTYTMSAALRDRLRSSRMHNTVVLNGREHASPGGAFRWTTRADARMLAAVVGNGFDFAVGTHDAYLPARHMRAVLAVHELGWLIVDRISGPGEVSAEAWWHLHPGWQAGQRDGVFQLRHASGRRLALATTAPALEIVDDPALTTYAPVYGRIEHGTTLRATRSGGGPFVLGTFIPAIGAFTESLAIAELEPDADDDWFTSRFSVSTARGELTFDIAFPRDPEAQPPTSWPRPCIAELVQSCAE